MRLGNYRSGTVNGPHKEIVMPILLWLLGVPVVVIIALMLTHVV